MHQMDKPLAKHKLIYVLVTGLISSTALAQSQPSLEITATGSQEATQSILTPTKILQGDELLNKLGTTLGATLANELGVSATGYGAGSSRPVIRGLEGARVQILQNGLSVGDVSNISQDHAVGNNMQNAHQVEILRGAAALLYGSGSSGGLVNVLNDRILTNLPDRATGAINTSYETVNNGRAASAEVDGAFGSVAVHVDTAINNANNYRIPGYANQGGPNQEWAINPGEPLSVPYSGKLPNSFSNQNNLGVGVSYIGQNGYTGVSVERLNNNYGIPTPEGGSINQSQNRYDLQHQTRDPFAGFSSFKFSAANSNYNHTEFNNAGEAASLWKNIANEARFELAHNPIAGWKGTFGAQVSAASLNATEVGTGSYAIVPPTKTNSTALFWIEEGKWNSLQGSLGLRYNNVAQKPNLGTELTPEPVDIGGNPDGNTPTITLQNRNFNLMSYSAGGLWNFMEGHGAGVAYTVSQRAPSAQELYSYGAHESTATFDIGNPNLNKETSHNLEFNIQKTSGLMRAKASIYANRFNNYIYGYYTGQSVPDVENFSVVVAQQAAATIKGVEGELTYNWRQHGLGGRVFGDASQGTFDAGGNLPLQPAPRLGAEIAHQRNGWLTNATYIYSYQQNRLANWEIGPAPSYNLLNAGISYTEKIKDVNWTVYMNLKNLLNEQIRYATTPMAVRLFAPQPGRSLMVGLRGTF
jgi:iron complex outermembrane receptor protein